MTANVAIIVAHKDDVLQIKNAALAIARRSTPVETKRTSTSRPGRPGGGRSNAGQRVELSARFMFCHLAPVVCSQCQVKTGISDGTTTEVIEGLKEGDRVVTSEVTSTSRHRTSTPANPFSGGQRRFP